MAWPKTVRMNLLVVLLIVAALAFLVQISIALSGVVVWAFLALSAVAILVSVAVNGFHRRRLTARDVAMADAPSFGDTVRRWKARDAL